MVLDSGALWEPLGERGQSPGFGSGSLGSELHLELIMEESYLALSLGFLLTLRTCSRYVPGTWWALGNLQSLRL